MGARLRVALWAVTFPELFARRKETLYLYNFMFIPGFWPASRPGR
jgi:hypothetical protein